MPCFPAWLSLHRETSPTNRGIMRAAPFNLGCALLALIIPVGVSASELVSQASRVSVSGSGGSFVPSFATDGSALVFVSQARNLTTNSAPGTYLNVFWRDLASSNTVLVSTPLPGEGSVINADAGSPSVSSSAQFIAFEQGVSSIGSNGVGLVARDVYVRDLRAGTTTLVSVDMTGTNGGNGFSTTPLISADGRWVVFESAATNLVANDTNGVVDVFARDLVADATAIVSVDTTNAGPTVGPTELASLSADGRYVTFVKRSSNLVSGVMSVSEVYVRDLEMEVTTWASEGVASHFLATTNAYLCFNAVAGADGQTVVFEAGESRASYSPGVLTSPVLVFRYSLQTGITDLISTNGSTGSCPAVSVDGRFIAYASESELYIFDNAAGTNRVIGAGDTAQFTSCRAPAMASDGGRVAFIASVSNRFGVYVHDWASGTTFPVSVNTNGTVSSPVAVTTPVISADGRLVAFESLASDLVANDFNQSSDVFVRDLNAGTTTLISARAPERPSSTGTGLMTLSANSVSADGRIVAFVSTDNELVEGDTNLWQDAVVRDLVMGTNIDVSLRTRDPSGPTTFTSLPQVSADGRYVAYSQRPVRTGPTNISWVDLLTGAFRTVPLGRTFPNGPISGRETGANFALSPDGRFLAFEDLFEGPGGNSVEIYLRDMLDPVATNELVTINNNGTGPGGGISAVVSTSPKFSPDGRWLAFQMAFPSSSPSLTTNVVAPYRPQIYCRDLRAKQTRLVSTDASGQAFGFVTNAAVFSGDSRFIFFHAPGAATVFPTGYRHELDGSGASEIVCENCLNLTASADGRLVAYETVASTTNRSEIVVIDLATGQTNLAGTHYAPVVFGGGWDVRPSPVISHDGHYVVFTSLASNLVPNDMNGTRDVFVRDLWAGTTLLASMNKDGTGSGNAFSTTPVLAANGRTVLFQSFASDLAPGDYNDTRDIFVLQLGGPDTDGDGMEDDWEMAHFNTLARDGAGDFDGDGRTDLQEFRAGTNPADDASVLRVMTLSALGASSTTVFWSAAPGRTYRVQFKSAVNDSAWTELAGDVVAAGTTGSKVDSAPASGQRFYRVLLVEEAAAEWLLPF